MFQEKEGDTPDLLKDTLFDGVIGGYNNVLDGHLERIEYFGSVWRYTAIIRLWKTEITSFDIQRIIRKLNQKVSVDSWELRLSDNTLEMMEYIQKHRDDKTLFEYKPPKQYFILELHVNPKKEVDEEKGGLNES